MKKMSTPHSFTRKSAHYGLVRFFATSVLILLFGVTYNHAAHQNIIKALPVSGQVTDAETGETLPGVNISISGTSTGTVTDMEGRYELEINEGSAVSLVFSFIGYETRTIEVEGRSIINVSLEPDAQQLDEIVVVGYGTQKRVNLSGAVDQIRMEEIQRRPLSSLSQGLQGVIPNLNIDFNEGSPGAEPTVNIRGFTSINEGEPLILIDGIPSSTREMTRLEPQDVESISVLKDAASAAIYGARASFGVILIQTKQGSREGMNINYTSRASWDRPTVLPNKTSDPYIYMRLQDISASNTPWNYISYSDDEYLWAKQRSDNPSSAPAVREDPNNPGTWQYMGDRDWINYFLSDFGFSTNHTLSLDGRNEKTSYYLSGSYDRQDGALQIAEDRFERLSMRSRVNYQPYPWLQIGNNTVINLSDRVMPSRWSWGSNAMAAFYEHAPMAWDVNPDGSWANTTVGHQAAQLTQGGDLIDGRQAFQTTFNLVAPIVANYLTFNADYTLRKELRNYNYDYKKYQVGHGPEDIREHGSTSVYRNRTTYDYNVFNVYGNLSLPLGRHNISSVVGFNQEYNKDYAVITSIANVISSELPSLSLSTGDPNTSDSYYDWAIRGAFFRLNYMFDNKYIVEFNGRYDGSSRFPAENRFGFFPSASLAWRLDQEAFLQGFEWLDVLKIRGSYGALGNQSVAAYGYIPVMSPGRSGYIIGDSRPLAISSPGLVSPDYTWERVNTQNIGLDIDLFGNRVSASFDGYNRQTLGMLTLGKELPAVLGASEPLENAADLETKGWEMTLAYRDAVQLAGKPFGFRTRFILADSRSFITSFDNPDKTLNQYYEGMEIGEIWGFEFDGLFQNEEEIAQLDQTNIIPWGALSIVPGWPKFVDQNGDGAILQGFTVDNPEDLKIIGNSQARYRYGFSFDFDFYNFDFSAFLQGVFKRDYYPRHYLYWSYFQQPYQGGYLHAFDYYRPTNDNDVLMAQHSQSYIDAGLANANTDSKFPIMQAWLADNREPGIGSIPNTGYMLNGSYLRLKNITVGYTLPKQFTRRFGVQNLRVFVSGENLYEWSELKEFFDPEAVTDNGLGYRYPFQRRYSAGLNLGF